MENIVIEIPANLKFLATPIRQLVGDVGKTIAQVGDGRACDYDALEELIVTSQ